MMGITKFSDSRVSTKFAFMLFQYRFSNPRKQKIIASSNALFLKPNLMQILLFLENCRKNKHSFRPFWLQRKMFRSLYPVLY